MGDAGEIKAKVTIEYDGGGLEKAKDDLKSLAEAAGSAGEGASGASEGLAQLEERAASASDGVAQLAENASSLEKPMQAGQTSVTELTDALGEHQAALEQAGESYKALAEPIGTTVSMLEEAGPPMRAIAEHAQVAAEQLGPVGDSFAQIGDSLSQSAPLLAPFAESMRVVDSTLAGSSQGFSNVHENMAVFQDALENPSPFSMINQHLSETGQTWDNFTSSIGDNNVAMLHDMASNADVTHQVLGGMASNVQSMGQTFYESADSTKAFTDQFNELKAAGADVNKTMAETSTAIEDVGKAAGGGGFAGWITNGGAKGEGGLAGVGGFFNGIMNGMNQIAMPLMAVQMIGMAVSAVGQGIYNAAAVAEGAGAHGISSFTGQLDLLTQNSQKAGQAFSEAFGQNLLPNIKAINNVTGGNDFWGGVGGVVGGALSFGLTAGELGIGGLIAATGWTSNPILQAGVGSVQNIFGLGPQGATPETPSQVYLAQQMPQIASNIEMMTAQSQVQTATIEAQAMTPSYLQSQDYASAATQYLARQQASYDASHPISQADIAQQAQYQAYAASQQLAYQNSPTYGQLAGQALSQGDWGGFFKQMDQSGAGDILSSLFPAYGYSSTLAHRSDASAGGFFDWLLGGSGEAHAATLPGGASGAFGQGGSSLDASGAISKTIPVTVSWSITGELAKRWEASSAWSLMGELNKGWQAVSTWSIVGDLMRMWEATSTWSITGDLVRMWEAVSTWNIAGDLMHTFEGAAQWVANELDHLFTGHADWVANDLEHLFQASVNWVANNLNPVFTLNPIINLAPTFAGALGMPGFASGVENFSGGPAMVGEGGGPEVVAYNGQYSLINNPTLMNLPSGSSVYPMQNLSDYALSGLSLSAMGARGGGVSPLSMGGGTGGGGPQSVNVVVQIDGQSIVSAIGMPLAQNIRVTSGMRGY